jgi:arabinogalactan endo-1,4-beta-galactosidase
MKKTRWMALLLFALVSRATLLRAGSYVIGADVSFLRQAERQGTMFKDNSKVEPVLQLLKDHGYNWVRLRLFVHPTNLPNNLDYTIASAQAAKRLGFKLLLDLHYSDTWADPGKQFTPKAWTDMTHEQLVNAVYEYTQSTIEAFRKAKVLPDMVQIGNEITNGMLWPDGKLPANWGHLTDLLKAGINGVDAGHGNEPRPKIMIHIDRGGDWKTTQYFFDHLLAYHVPFDVIGQSYYPWWQGSLNDLRQNLYQTATRFHKPIILAEVAYPWKQLPFHAPAKFKNLHPKFEAPPFPMTPQGQRDFLHAVYRIVQDTPDSLGKGLFWWEPAVPRSSADAGLVTRGFFDESGNALPVVTVFDEYTRR